MLTVRWYYQTTLQTNNQCYPCYWTKTLGDQSGSPAGDKANKWGFGELKKSDVKNKAFGVYFTCENIKPLSSPVQAYVDSVQMTIYWANAFETLYAGLVEQKPL